MDREEILDALLAGRLDKRQAIDRLKPVDDIGFAQLDIHRKCRTGFPEVIFGEGKSPEQLVCIVERLILHAMPILITRISETSAEALVERLPQLEHHPEAEIVNWRPHKTESCGLGHIAVISAGTSDRKVSEEAALTAEHLGSAVKRYYDVGVAGLHRLFRKLSDIRKSNVMVVVAGMDGVLPSIVGGLVDKPVIAVPTSVGYGAQLNGLAPLLTMLNSCASGVTVVNIDNGFGGGYAAAQILRNMNRFVKRPPDE